MINDSCLEFELENKLNTLPTSIKEHNEVIRNMAIYFGNRADFLDRRKLNYLYFLTDVEQYSQKTIFLILSDLKYLATEEGPIGYSLVTGKELFDEIKDLFEEKERALCCIESEKCKTEPCDEGGCRAQRDIFLILKPDLKFSSEYFNGNNMRNLSNVCWWYTTNTSKCMLEYLKCTKHAWYPTFLKEKDSRISFKYYEQFMSEAQLRDRAEIRRHIEQARRNFSDLLA